MTTEQKQLPHNRDAERALLGACMIDERQVDLVCSLVHEAALAPILNPDFPGGKSLREGEPLFFFISHSLIFRAIIILSDRKSLTIDTLAIHLHDRGELEGVGGAPYLATLVDELYSLHQVPEYCAVVEEHWRHRRVLRAAQKILNGNLTAKESLEALETETREIVDQSTTSGFRFIGEDVDRDLREKEEIRSGRMDEVGLLTGFQSIDKILRGLRPGNMAVLAARPSMGKSALSLGIALNIAMRQQAPVAFFSMEMSTAELLDRCYAHESRVDHDSVKSPRGMNELKWKTMCEAAQRIKESPLLIDDTPDVGPRKFLSRSRRIKSRHPSLALIVLDYLQLMHGDKKNYANDNAELTDISREIKLTAKELGVPILALSQMSRNIEWRAGGKQDEPKLSDLRASGAIEQDADIVFFLHSRFVKDNAPQEVKDAAQNTRDVLVRKNRNGACGNTKLAFENKIMRFTEYY